MPALRVLVLEPYYGGSHRDFTDTITSGFPNIEFTVHTLRGKKWQWKSRTSSIHFSTAIKTPAEFDVLIASSMVNLAELLGMRADLHRVPRKLLYFHENQLAYPKRQKQQERDYAFPHAQIVSCLAADVVLWNSNFNLQSFLDGLKEFVGGIPLESEAKPNVSELRRVIERKSVVRYVPVSGIPQSIGLPIPEAAMLLIGFPHRWEHDKDPAAFLRVLLALHQAQVEFRVAVFGGESFENCDAKALLLDACGGREDRIEHCGHLPSKLDYHTKLAQCDVVISMAVHEYFGIAMVESARLGCKVLCPNRLSYPEIFQKDSLYNSEQKLIKVLINYAKYPAGLRAKRLTGHGDLRQDIWEAVDWDGNPKSKQLYEDTLRGEAAPLIGLPDLISDTSGSKTRPALAVLGFAIAAFASIQLRTRS